MGRARDRGGGVGGTLHLGPVGVIPVCCTGINQGLGAELPAVFTEPGSAGEDRERILVNHNGEQVGRHGNRAEVREGLSADSAG